MVSTPKKSKKASKDKPFRNPGVVDLRGHNTLRDAPSNLDPYDFYAGNYAKAKANATGVERLVYAYIPYSVIRSFAIAIDPTAKFKAVSWRVTPVNRTRLRSRSSVLQLRTYRRSARGTACSKEPNYGGQLVHFGPYKCVYSNTVLNTTVLSKQLALNSTTKDTTSRTRSIRSDMGEFEHFDFNIYSPSRAVRYEYRSNVTIGYPNGQVDGNTESTTRTSEIIGPAATLSQGNLNSVLSNEQAYASTLMSKNVGGMLTDIMPTSRRFSFFRELVELRDLPRSITQLRATLANASRTFDALKTSKDLSKILSYSKTSLKDIPKEYVGYHFGWRQLYKAVHDLLTEPAKIAGRVNYLQKRSGLPTTHKLRRKFSSQPTVSPPAFFYDSLAPEEYSASQVDASKRETELRMVINLTFDFPKIEIPKFQNKLYLQKLGVYPSFTDLYNLTPWTWLLDWFTGLGNYVSAIDIINTDPSLINWGFITCVSKGETSSIRSSKSDRFYSDRSNGVLTEYTNVVSNVHTSKLFYTYQLRKAIGATYGVKTLAEPTSLTLYQQSILGAILAARTPTRSSIASRG